MFSIEQSVKTSKRRDSSTTGNLYLYYVVQYKKLCSYLIILTPPVLGLLYPEYIYIWYLNIIS